MAGLTGERVSVKRDVYLLAALRQTARTNLSIVPLRALAAMRLDLISTVSSSVPFPGRASLFSEWSGWRVRFLEIRCREL